MPRLFQVAALLLIGACATPYQAFDGSGGYADEKIAEGTYNLVYVASGETDVMEVYRMWHRRARELCGSEEYEHSLTQRVNTRDDTLTTPLGKGTFLYTPTQLLVSRSVEGTVKCR
jgi:hypothetical protein